MIASCQLSVGHGGTSDEEEIYWAPSECWVLCQGLGPREDGLQLQEAHAPKNHSSLRQQGGPGLEWGKAPWRLKDGEAAPVMALWVAHGGAGIELDPKEAGQTWAGRGGEGASGRGKHVSRSSRAG